jgi:hypothetical protein
VVEIKKIIVMLISITFIYGILNIIPISLPCLAEVVGLDMPKPRIISISPQIIDVKEGEYVQVYVTVINEGTEGYIHIALKGELFAITSLTETERMFKEGEEFTFGFRLYALNVFNDRTTEIIVFTEGRGGSETSKIPAIIRDVEGYSPPTMPQSSEKVKYWFGLPEFITIIFLVLIIIFILLYKYKKLK